MPVDFESLRKVLELERKKGFTNTAVFGGLDKFLSNWSAMMAGTITDPGLVNSFLRLHLANPEYGALSTEHRKLWIEKVFKFIDDAARAPETKEEKKTSADLAITKTVKPPKQKAYAIISTGQSLDSPVTVVPGLSTVLSKKFKKLGVRTVRDLLYFFPRRHIDYSRTKTISQIEEGEEQTVIVNIWEAQQVRLGDRPSTEAVVGDATGNMRVVWFNQPYLAKTLTANMRIVLSGRVGVFHGRYVFESPEWELAEEQELTHTGRLVPVYPLTQGLRPRQMRRIMKPFIDKWAGLVEDFLPFEIKQRCKLLSLSEAVSNAHYPADEKLKDKARIRLAFDELFLLQLGVFSKKRDWQKSQPGTPFVTKTTVVETFLKSLPFELTEPQKRSLKEIISDLQKPVAMSRLLQGDVGSGKTVVATAALLAAAANGYQSVFMAPTEILAEQHFATIRQLFSKIGKEEEEGVTYKFQGLLPRPLGVALLMGDIKHLKKSRIQELLKNGGIDIAIGTHALIQKGIEFQKLGLVVVDEQHRFGVEQRSALRQKGFNPHMLVMTATPIPRTLALTLYGDLDLSVIERLPPGRQTIKTKWLGPPEVQKAYNFIKRQVAEGHQAFIICPLIEESEMIQAKAATAEYERLSEEVFPELQLGLLHGRMSSAEKDEAMRQFRCGETHILVSTPVIEVGIDIPNAAVMMVESADRFGLSQLHQFRGRVGRGMAQSYCILMAENPSAVGKQRLDIIEKTQDGFALAEADLEMRGPGEFFGTRQSGLPDLRMAKISDVVLLETARNEAVKLFEKDALGRGEHQLLVKELARV
ncbi:ATP-dependent DNA helicase RecG, partial [Chloroflexota bacterium]